MMFMPASYLARFLLKQWTPTDNSTTIINLISPFSCIRCRFHVPDAEIFISEDSTIFLTAEKARHVKKALRLNPFGDGIAADIVLKEQYDCEQPNFNGRTGVRGIPLDPVMRKDFNDGDNVFFWRFVTIELGKVP